MGVSSFSPAALSQAPQAAANLALGIIERADEAVVERTGAVLDAMEPPKPFIAAGLVDGTDTDLACVDLETVRAVVGFVAEFEH